MNDKPLVSYCIVSYNAEKFIQEAIESALNQDYYPMEIIISDDCSTDNTYEVIKNVTSEYKGDKKIIINRNEHNIGPRENYNKVMYELSKGEILIFGDGDDVSTTNRTSEYVKQFVRFPEIMMVSCLSDETYEDGTSMMKNFEWSNTVSIYNFEDFASNTFQRIYSGDSRGIRRDVIEKFPPLKYSQAEDMQVFVRCLMLGSGCYLRTPFVKRRHHDNNLSGKPMSQTVLTMWKKQIDTDIEYAFSQNYITKFIYTEFKRKINFVYWLYNVYDVPLLHSIKSFVYQLLNKYFVVKRYR